MCLRDQLHQDLLELEVQMLQVLSIPKDDKKKITYKISNGAELGGATGAMAPLVFWSRSLKKSRNQSLVVQSGTSCF